MPKENTHLFFAHTLLPHLKDQELRMLISRNLAAYCLGSVTLDAFYYSANETVAYVSDLMHGEDGRLTNEVIFRLLDTARADNHEEMLIYTLGYITHCALDMVFHPIVCYLTGNHQDDNQQRRIRAMYKHRLIETYIDSKVNNYYYIDKIVDLRPFAQFAGFGVIAKEYGISMTDVSRAFERMIKCNRRFRSPFWYGYASLLLKVGFRKYGLVMPLFYATLKKEAAFSHGIISEGGYDSREAFAKTLDDLMQKAYLLSEEMMRAALSYHQGVLTQAECAKVITGVNLVTGRIDVLPRKMRFAEEA